MSDTISAPRATGSGASSPVDAASGPLAERARTAPAGSAAGALESGRDPSEPRFRARRQWQLDEKPEFVVAGDVDGDGDEDLLAATQEGSLLLWRAGPDGLARPPERIAVGGYPLEPQVLPADGAAGDPDGPRVLIASRATGSLVPWDLRGDAGAEIRTLLPWTPRALHARPAARGGRSLAVAGDGGTRVGLEASATFANPDALPRCARVLAGGRLAVGYQDSRAVRVFDEAGRVLATLALGGIPRDLEEADLDGDGDLELVVAGGDDALWVLGWGRPGGAEAWLAEDGREPLVWSTGRVPIDVDATDLDGDGRPELLVTHAQGLSCALHSDFAAEGPRTSWRAYVGQTARSACVVDVDGDGRRDLVVANRDALALSVLRGLPGLAFETATSVPVGGFPNELAVGDFDGNGRPDAAVVNAKDGTVTPLRNVDGALVPLDALSEDAPLSSPSFARSVDGARDELYVVDAVSDLIRYFFHPDDARLGHELFEFGLGLGRARVVEFAEGEPPDVVVTDLGGEPPDGTYPGTAGYVHFFNARADTLERLGLSWVSQIPTASGTFLQGTRAWAEIRFDDDPAPELVLVGGGPGEPRGFYVLDRRIRGLSTAARVRSELYPLDAACGDVDGDGREDVVLVCNDRWDGTDGFVQVFLRRDGAEFEAREPVPTGLKPRHVDAGDLDGDGRADVVVAAQNSHVVNVWLSREREGQSFLRRLDDVGAGLGCLDVKLADVDGDGALDLLVANAFSDDVSVVLVERP